MKNKPDIPDLLERYWEGETTLEEERRLKEFFATEPVPEQFRQEALLFRALRAQQSVQMPAGREMTVSPRPTFRLAWAAAASVALVICAGIWWQHTQSVKSDTAITQNIPNDKPPLQTTFITPKSTPEPEKVVQESVTATVHRQPATVDRQPSTVNRQPSTVNHQPEAVPPDTYEDPEKALEEIKAVLALVSTKINKSKQEIDKGLHEVEAVDILFKKKKETNG